MLNSFMRLIMINSPIAVNIRPLIPRQSRGKCQDWKCHLFKRPRQVAKWGQKPQPYIRWRKTGIIQCSIILHRDWRWEKNQAYMYTFDDIAMGKSNSSPT